MVAGDRRPRRRRVPRVFLAAVVRGGAAGVADPGELSLPGGTCRRGRRGGEPRATRRGTAGPCGAGGWSERAADDRPAVGSRPPRPHTLADPGEGGCDSVAPLPEDPAPDLVRSRGLAGLGRGGPAGGPRDGAPRRRLRSLGPRGTGRHAGRGAHAAGGGGAVGRASARACEYVAALARGSGGHRADRRRADGGGGERPGVVGGGDPRRGRGAADPARPMGSGRGPEVHGAGSPQPDRVAAVSRGGAARDGALVLRLIRAARPCWMPMAGAFLLSLLATPLALLAPLPFKIAVDSVVGSHPLPHALTAWLPPAAVRGPESRLLLAATLLLAIAVGRQLQDVAAKYLRTAAVERLTLDLRA